MDPTILADKLAEIADSARLRSENSDSLDEEEKISPYELDDEFN
jgi:hypothetical protein